MKVVPHACHSCAESSPFIAISNWDTFERAKLLQAQRKTKEGCILLWQHINNSEGTQSEEGEKLVKLAKWVRKSSLVSSHYAMFSIF